VTDPTHLHLFERYGIELEYMLVDAETLDVLPVADRVLHAVAGDYVSDVEQGDVAWSNELTLHVIELKTNGPVASLAPVPAAFQQDVQRINEILAPLGGRLLPTAMHPWMDPRRETRLWPHEYREIYETFDRVFDCRRHGWANLQSVHINLPFADDAEFARLHAAIRLVLPILPALAASSPVRDGRLTGLMDTRLDTYRANAARVPFITGRVIPEPVYTRGDYERTILRPMYADIAPFDAEGVLQEEFLNARGAIARFCRNTIEIRLLDMQECPPADLAICSAVIAVLQRVVAETWSSLAAQQAVEIAPLERILLATIRDAEQAVIDDGAYLAHFGVSEPRLTARELWQHLVAATRGMDSAFAAAGREPLDIILRRGPLARRIAAALGAAPSPERIREVYRDLADCLSVGRLFDT
jgi:hypothetical protein